MLIWVNLNLDTSNALDSVPLFNDSALFVYPKVFNGKSEFDF